MLPGFPRKCSLFNKKATLKEKRPGISLKYKSCCCRRTIGLTRMELTIKWLFLTEFILDWLFLCAQREPGHAISKGNFHVFWNIWQDLNKNLPALLAATTAIYFVILNKKVPKQPKADDKMKMWVAGNSKHQEIGNNNIWGSNLSKVLGNEDVMSVFMELQCSLHSALPQQSPHKRCQPQT